MLTVIDFLEEHANIIGLISSICMLLVTIIYAIITWWQARYTKRTFVETIKQNREERQPYIVPTIRKVSGVAFDTSTYLRIQFTFNYKLENVGDSSAVTLYTMIYAKMESQSDHKLVYGHLMPNYKHALKVGEETEERLHFETNETRDIVEDLEICHAKNMKRIETDPSISPYRGPVIILRTLYQNMVGQWFESVLEQELLDVEIPSKKVQEEVEVDEKRYIIKKKGRMVTNKGIKDKDAFDGGMINPCYSKLSRRMVGVEYVKQMLRNCRDNSDSKLDYWEDAK